MELYFASVSEYPYIFIQRLLDFILYIINMILTEKDLQLLSSLPAPVPEEKREMDLKIGEY